MSGFAFDDCMKNKLIVIFPTFFGLVINDLIKLANKILDGILIDFLFWIVSWIDYFIGVFGQVSLRLLRLTEKHPAQRGLRLYGLGRSEIR